MTDAEQLAQAIAAELRRRLLGEYVPRIRHCVQRLGETGVWQRPAPNCNSVGNLLLHLNGNTTQWILHGVGSHFADGALIDQRNRPAEFSAESGATGEELCKRLATTCERACAIVEQLSPAALLQPRTIQGFAETGLSAVLHVLEHFSGHAGQIYSWTKQATGQDLRFYDL